MFKQIFKQKWFIVLVIILMILEPTINSVLSFWLQKIFNTAKPDADGVIVFRLLTIGFLLWILKRVISFISSVLTSKFICNIKEDIKHRMFVKIFKLDTSSILSKGASGEYISLFTNDITILENRFFEQIVSAISGVFSIVILGSSFIFLNYKLGIPIIIFGIITMIIPFVFSKKINEKQLSYSTSISELTQKIKEYTTAYPTIKNYSIESRIINRFIRTNKKTETTKFEVDYSLTLANNVGMILAWFMQFIAVGLGIMLVIKGEILIGTVISAQAFANDLANPLQGLVININSIKSIKEILNKIEEFSSSEDVEPLESNLSPSEINNEISFENVSLKIENSDIINNFSFTFKEGKKYLIVGLNGAGKSTLFKLLKKWYKHHDGCVKIGGHDINNLTSTLISKKVSYMNEHVMLFSGSVKDNITLFNEYDENTFLDAVKTAQIKLQLDRMINDEGKNISSGEQRRIEIARSLLNDVNILIFDEVVSTLDIETAYEIEKMAIGYKDKTVIFVSHNFSGKLIEEYDEILVIDNGYLVSNGNYDYLINNCEYFKKICDIKFGNLN